MRNLPATAFVNAVAGRLGANMQPRSSRENIEQSLLYGHRILTRLVADATCLPRLQDEAMNAYAIWKPEAKVLLRDAGDLKTIVQLEQALEQRDYSAVEIAVQRLCAQLSTMSGHGPPEARLLRRQAALIEQRLEAGYLSAYSALLSQFQNNLEAAASLSPQQLERLTRWLKERFSQAGELTIAGIDAVPGGFSKHTFFMHLEGASDMPATLVIRMDWANSPVTGSVRNEFHLLKSIFDAGITVPRPYAAEPTGDVLGQPFMLLGLAQGTNVGDVLDVWNGSPALSLELAHSLGRLHSLPLDRLRGQSLNVEITPRERMAQDIEQFENNWRATNVSSIALEIAFAWLKENIHLSDGPRALIHRDAGPHNLLSADGRLTALIDWEHATIGAAAQDLGYIYPAVIQMCDWADFMGAYIEAGGKEPTTEQLNYYTLWGYTWTMSNLTRGRAAFGSGATQDIRMGYADAYYSSRFQARLTDMLQKLV